MREEPDILRELILSSNHQYIFTIMSMMSKSSHGSQFSVQISEKSKELICKRGKEGHRAVNPCLSVFVISTTIKRGDSTKHRECEMQGMRG